MQTTSNGAVVWFEISTADVSRAKGFYENLLGWRFQDTGSPDYTLIFTPNVEGMLNRVSEPGGHSVVIYMQVGDLQKAFSQALELGASPLLTPRPIPGKGAFAVIRDLDGNRIGLFSSGM